MEDDGICSQTEPEGGRGRTQKHQLSPSQLLLQKAKSLPGNILEAGSSTGESYTVWKGFLFFHVLALQNGVGKFHEMGIVLKGR